MQLTFETQPYGTEEVLVIPMLEGNTPAAPLSATLQKFVDGMLTGEKDFTGKNGQVLTLKIPGKAKKIILAGLGDKKNIDEQSLRKLGTPLYKALKETKGAAISVYADGLSAANTAVLADALTREAYDFKKYKTAEDSAPEMEIRIGTGSPQAAEKAFEPLQAVTNGSAWASDLANEPGNSLNPETYARKIRDELSALGVEVTVLEQQDMLSYKMGAALAVGQGSDTPPCMVVMEYDGTGGKQKQPLALVGKGITFDTGGISLKPGANMDQMTLDMGGSAAVVGTMRALAARQAKTRVVAIVALAENMPDGKSYRPGDIVTSMSGKTVFVGNTDAEGRLVLIDALTYIQREHNPHTVIDLATLTGAQVVALGNDFAATYSNDNKLRDQFNAAGAKSGEKTWPMPLMETDSYTKAVKDTPLADLTNLAKGPGSCTAAAFLHEFIEKDDAGKDKCKWTHIDMAGPGMGSGIKKGWGVLVLNQLIQDNFEQKVGKKRAKASKHKTP